MRIAGLHLISAQGDAIIHSNVWLNVYLYVYSGRSPLCFCEVLLLLIKLRWVIDVRRSNDQPCDAASRRKRRETD